MLKEIKTKYEAKCVQCSRTLRAGWTAYYEPDGKKLYCKPCGIKIGVQLKQEESLQQSNPPTIDEVTDLALTVNEMASQVQLNGDMLAATGDRLTAIFEVVNNLGERLTALISATEELKRAKELKQPKEKQK